MRMEELNDNNYIKNPDSVERYLLNLVQEYFKNSNIASTTSREYVIKRAVERMKEEITFDSIGVLSITLPDGEVKTGAVTITLEDLNGEPLISPKHSAFNVPFGDQQNTACEGNDPRLSDARKPLPHQHEITDIIGLEGILSTIIGKVERVNSSLHDHGNKKVLDMLVYTGNNSVIDLTLLDTLENKILQIVTEIRNEIIQYTNEVNTKVTQINNQVTQIETKIQETKQFVLDKNKEYFEKSKAYTDTQVKAAKKAVDDIIAKLVTKDTLNTLVSIANETYTKVEDMSIEIKSIFQINSTVTVSIPSTTLDLIAARGQLVSQCMFEFHLSYTDAESGKKVKAELPYILLTDDSIDGSIQCGVNVSANKYLVSFNTLSGQLPEEIMDGSIIATVYSKQVVSI